MDDYNDLILTCASPLDIVKAKNLLNPHLPLDVRHKMNQIFIYYLHHYGVDGAFERMNNRAIGSIISEFAPSGGLEPIASGERDGVRYQRFESSEKDKASESLGSSQDPPADG